MEYLQYLWLYAIALFPIHEMYLSVSGYIDIDYIESILDHLWYIGRVLSLYSIHYRSSQLPRFLLIKNTAKVTAAETARISNIRTHYHLEKSQELMLCVPFTCPSNMRSRHRCFRIRWWVLASV